MYVAERSEISHFDALPMSQIGSGCVISMKLPVIVLKKIPQAQKEGAKTIAIPGTILSILSELALFASNFGEPTSGLDVAGKVRKGCKRTI